MLENLHNLKGGENVQQPMITVKRVGHPEQIIMNDVSKKHGMQGKIAQSKYDQQPVQGKRKSNWRGKKTTAL